MNSIVRRRHLVDIVALLFAGLATTFGLVFLAWILWTTVSYGAAALTPALITQMTPPPGASGGLLNAFYGSAVMVGLALLIGTPIGIAAGTYLAEHGRHTKLAASVRNSAPCAWLAPFAGQPRAIVSILSWPASAATPLS